MMFLVFFRENIVCQCKAKDGSYYECGTHLIGGPLCSNPSKEFYCNNGRVCAIHLQKCDSNDDCGSWYDESTCSRTKYPAEVIKANLRLFFSN